MGPRLNWRLRSAAWPVQSSCVAANWSIEGDSADLGAGATCARSSDVAVFFISGRPPNLREATERNLREQGYEWTGLILAHDAQLASAVDFEGA